MLPQSLEALHHNGREYDRPEVVGRQDGGCLWHWDDRGGLEASWDFGLVLKMSVRAQASWSADSFSNRPGRFNSVLFI